MSFQRLGHEFQELRAEYRRGIPAKLDRLEALWSLILKEIADDERLKQLRRELHTIAGSAGTFGLPHVGDAARAAETCLGTAAGAASLDAAQRAEFARLLGELKNASLPPG